MRYALELLVFPISFLVFLIHRFLVFLSQEGAKYILLLVIAAPPLAFGATIDAMAGGRLTPLARDVLNLTEPGTPLYDHSLAVLGIVVGAGCYMILHLGGHVLRPIMSALPAPDKPLTPMPILAAPVYRFPEVQVRSVVPKRRRGRFRGELQMLTPLLPAEIGDVIEHYEPAIHEDLEPPIPADVTIDQISPSDERAQPRRRALRRRQV